MEGSNNDTSVDGFRFINNLNTTARQLFICSEIVKQLGSKQLPNELLNQLLFKWSKEQEEQNILYKTSKGKLTDEKKETSALKHYLDLLDFLGLITRFNNFYSNSRLSYILLYAMNTDENSSNRFEITFGEKLFYIFQLFSVDADGILYVLSELSKGPTSQKQLQNGFKDGFNIRLLSKKELASDIIRNQISEKYRTINFVWKKTEKYAEHLLIPRCAWLSTLGLIEIEKKGNFTIYSLTSAGKHLYEAVPALQNNVDVKDVKENWIHNNLFGLYNELFCNSEYKSFVDLNEVERNFELGSSLDKALSVIKTSSSFRIPLFDSLLFVCLEMFLEKKIVINFSNIFAELTNGFSFMGKEFVLKEAGRINEGYITTRIAE